MTKEGHYINPKTTLQKSNIEGRGLFAEKHIDRGEIIHISEGRIHHIDDETLTGEEWGFCYHIDKERLFCPLDYKNLAPEWYINHSCDPNCGASADGDWKKLVAVRDINPEEEITYDYADDGGNFQIVCRCGSSSCRGIITGSK